MTTKRKNTKNPVIVHGLSAHLEKWKHDGRLGYVKAMNKAREGLAQLFPQGVSAAPAMLIDRIVYKVLKLSMFEAMDLQGAKLEPGAHQRYLNMANSLREDLRLLAALAAKQPPEKAVPDLQEYLAALKEAGKSVAIVSVEKGEE